MLQVRLLQGHPLYRRFSFRRIAFQVAGQGISQMDALGGDKSMKLRQQQMNHSTSTFEEPDVGILEFETGVFGFLDTFL